jgi:hypothetical protein
MYKVYNNMVPQYVLDLFPININERSNYELRNPENFTVPFSRTTLMRKSCIPNGIDIWNGLDTNVKLSLSLSSFKNIIKDASKSLVKPYYLHGTRILAVQHARIRNRCSNLNLHLFYNHLTISPLCTFCNSVEDAEHFFFVCRRFQTQRLVFFRETRVFHPLSTKTLLFGLDSVSIEGNCKLFEAVHNYIKCTKRFQE